jgi:hypothetical protein
VWHAVRLAWDGDGRRCRVDVDGRRAAVLAAARSSPGVCYLRLRAAADGIDPAGALIDRVEVRAT